MFTTGGFLSTLIGLYEFCIVAYAILSWFQGSGGLVRELYSLLATVCEPFVGLIRRVLPGQIVGGMGIDLSPLVAILILSLLQGLVARAGL